MIKIIQSLTAALILLSTPLTAHADPEACRDATDTYNTARGDLMTALDAYRRCVADSRGHDDCASEFDDIESARGDFEGAVSAYKSACE